MSVHMRIFHGKDKPVFELGMPILLDKDMFCICGFKTHSGNKMGKKSYLFMALVHWLKHCLKRDLMEAF